MGEPAERLVPVPVPVPGGAADRPVQPNSTPSRVLVSILCMCVSTCVLPEEIKNG